MRRKTNVLIQDPIVKLMYLQRVMPGMRSVASQQEGTQETVQEKHKFDEGKRYAPRQTKNPSASDKQGADSTVQDGKKSLNHL